MSKDTFDINQFMNNPAFYRCLLDCEWRLVNRDGDVYILGSSGGWGEEYRIDGPQPILERLLVLQHNLRSKYQQVERLARDLNDGKRFFENIGV